MGLRGESRHAPHSGKSLVGKGTKAALVAPEPGTQPEPQAGSGRLWAELPSLHGFSQGRRSAPWVQSHLHPPMLSLSMAGGLEALCPQSPSPPTAPRQPRAPGPPPTGLDTPQGQDWTPPCATGPVAKKATQPRQSLPVPTPRLCAAHHGLSARGREQGAGRGLASLGRGLSGTSAIHSLEMGKGRLPRLG